jgi:tetratricopeptide (TPR) repeat protein
MKKYLLCATLTSIVLLSLISGCGVTVMHLSKPFSSDKALRMLDKDPNLYMVLGDTSYIWGKINKDPNLYAVRGEAYYKLGKYDKAIDAYSKAIELDFDNYDYYKKRALLYYETDKYQEALDDFTKVSMSYKSGIDVYYYKSLMNYKLKKYKEGLADFNVFLKLDSNYKYKNIKEYNSFIKNNKYIPHKYIYINNDKAFDKFNGVTGGSGTENDPYIISGWEILIPAKNYNGITIRDTTKYIVIRDCYVHGIKDMDSNNGIQLDNVKNIKIENVKIEYADDGIVNYKSEIKAISHSTITECRWNGGIANHGNIEVISNCIIKDCKNSGIYNYPYSNIKKIINCNIENNKEYAIYNIGNTIEAINNWWGDINNIEKKIYGKIEYEPWLNEEIKDAGIK